MARGEAKTRQAASVVPESEMSHLADQGVKLSALPKSDFYRVTTTVNDGSASFKCEPCDAEGNLTDAVEEGSEES